MNKILKEIEKIIYESRKNYLSDVTEEQLEEKGAVYYMNGKNGTEFDWYVNEKLSDFMVFYNDKNNLGAVKLTLYTNGMVSVFLYGDCGKTILKEIQTEIKACENEILKLAVLLKNQADNRSLWDCNILKLDSDAAISNSEIEGFCENKKRYEDLISKKQMYQKTAYVSKKILEEGWKVGYMIREEAYHNMDSGWSFMAGNEDDAYLNDSKNIAILQIGQVYQLDKDIFAHIHHPVGTALIRVSSENFEIDTNEKEIFLEKREK